MSIQGKGFYIWQISRCENGNPEAIADEAVKAGLTHVLIKIADGTSPYNVDPTTGQDYVAPLVQTLRNAGISPLGWHYVYGYEPIEEADIALARLQALNLDAYVIDAEAQYKEPGKEIAAEQFMSRLRATLPNFPIALSSYRYPTYHPTFPWQAFLEQVDINMPQVYWVLQHNPGEQLIRSVQEFEAIEPFRPIIPTGSAYIQGDWAPTVDDINEFMNTARALNLSAANFWEWGHTRYYAPQLWDAVAAYDWPLNGSDLDIAEKYIAALNSHDSNQVVGLYTPNAAHVMSMRTISGTQAILSWYNQLLNQMLPGGIFILGEVVERLGSRHFTWSATTTTGKTATGADSIGVVGNLITYHFTQFTITG